MMPYRVSSLLVLALILHANLACALERTNSIFKIFQFPANAIPRIDGKADDWDIVPEDYVIGTDQVVDDTGKHAKPDPKTLDVRVKVGWVKGINRLYFLYKGYDDDWDFGDGETSTEQHPLHHYKDAGKYVVTLSVEGPKGKARLSKVWDVVVK